MFLWCVHAFYYFVSLVFSRDLVLQKVVLFGKALREDQ